MINSSLFDWHCSFICVFAWLLFSVKKLYDTHEALARIKIVGKFEFMRNHQTHTLFAWWSIIYVMLIKLSCAQLPLISLVVACWYNQHRKLFSGWALHVVKWFLGQQWSAGEREKETSDCLSQKKNKIKNKTEELAQAKKDHRDKAKASFPFFSIYVRRKANSWAADKPCECVDKTKANL